MIVGANLGSQHGAMGAVLPDSARHDDYDRIRENCAATAHGNSEHRVGKEKVKVVHGATGGVLGWHPSKRNARRSCSLILHLFVNIDRAYAFGVPT